MLFVGDGKYIIFLMCMQNDPRSDPLVLWFNGMIYLLEMADSLILVIVKAAPGHPP